jgi:enoyl-CoA hydratase
VGDTVLYEKKGNIGFVKLNRPEVLNAENDQLIIDFVTALNKARWDDTRVVILKGEGRAFCAGADLKEGSKPRSVEDEFSHAERVQEISRLMANMGKPMIAAVKGYAMGGGCEFALGCDIRIAAEGTVFGFPETTVGATVTNMGNQSIARLIGMGRAKELVFTGRRIDAKKAEEWGLVNKVVPLEELDKAAIEMAKEIAAKDPLGIKLARLMLDTGADVDLETVLRIETLAAVTSFAGGARQKDMQIALKKTKEKK